jgi:5'-deoxynucleotidase YfbR-like HD superfamily hydrolase
MGRLKELRRIIDEELSDMDPKKKTSAIAHLYGVSLSATLIATHRHENSELASMAGMLHDIAAYKTGSYDDHAHRGAKMAKELLESHQLTDEKETALIVSAVYHHDDKLVVDAPFDEVLKDADVMHHVFNDLDKPVKDKEKARYEALCKEFGL